MRFDRQRLWNAWLRRGAARLAASAILLTACSCSAVNRPLSQASTDPFLDDSAPSQPAPATKPAQMLAAARPVGSRPAAARAARPKQQVQLAGYESAAAEGAIERTSAEPRVPCVFECPVIDESPTALAKIYPDEYLFDGGDRDLPIHFEQTQMVGLDTEDAAIEYVDVGGNRRVRPTTRVALYAPRFAAVTSVSQPFEGVGGGRPVESVVRLSQGGLDNLEATFAHQQRDAAERMLSRSRGSGLKTNDTAGAIETPVAPLGHVHTTVIVGDFAFVRTGQFKQTDEPRLAESIDSAIVWTRDQNPVILAKSDKALELKGRFAQEEIVGQENQFKGKERLRIVKLADKRIAVPGDVVNFTIRYDNIGDRPVFDVAIVDNLTPRLEYVEDSATCDRDGQLVVEDNGEGSLILRWELDEPLPARSGGVVTFQAVVR